MVLSGMLWQVKPGVHVLWILQAAFLGVDFIKCKVRAKNMPFKYVCTEQLLQVLLRR